MTAKLRPFPVDDTALDMLERAIDPGSEAARSCLTECLDLISAMGSGAEAADDVEVTRYPAYHHNDVIRALIAEIRRLRTPAVPAWTWTHSCGSAVTSAGVPETCNSCGQVGTWSASFVTSAGWPATWTVGGAQ